MRSLIAIGIAAVALAAPAAAGNAQLVVAMHGPGCHWFSAAGKYTKSAVGQVP